MYYCIKSASGEGVLKTKTSGSGQLPEECSVSLPIETPDCIKRKESNLKLGEDEVQESKFVVGSYNPKKHSGSLLENIEEQYSNKLMGDQSGSTSDDNEGLFFGDLEGL